MKFPPTAANRRRPNSCTVTLLLLSLAFDGTRTRSATHALHMDRISLPEFSSSFASSDKAAILEKPVVIEGALDFQNCEDWFNRMWERSKKEQCMNVQRWPNHLFLGEPSSSSSSTTTLMNLERAMEKVLYESSHSDPIYATSIGSSCSTDQLPVYDLIESIVRDTYDYNNNDDDDDGSSNNSDIVDWFLHFARYVPIHDTLALAGDGCTSRLSSHPFTKFSFCLDGNQLWRVLPPGTFEPCSNSGATKSSSSFFESIETKAWDEYSVSMGYQSSKYDLFEFRHQDVVWDDEETDDDDDENNNKDHLKYDTFEWWADDEELLRPNLGFTKDDWYSTVQLTGDVVMVPPGWWYQNYNVDGGSTSILSQRCSNTCIKQFIQHILQTSDLLSSTTATSNHNKLPLLNNVRNYFDYKDSQAQTVVKELFDLLEEKYYHD